MGNIQFQNFNCVLHGQSPKSMGYYLINKSSKKLTLSNDICECVHQHFGFGIHRGKFKSDWEPQSVIEAGGDSKCWMSAREQTLIGPAGWVKYNVEGGSTLNIIFDYDGLNNSQNFLQVDIYNCTSMRVSVRQKNIENIIANGFEGSDVNRQFEIVISNVTNNNDDN